MKRLAAIGIVCMVMLFLAQVSISQAGNGFMGGRGTIVVEDPPVVDEGDAPVDDGGIPDTVEGPLNDNMAEAGKLFGDLYKILRYEGDEGTYGFYDLNYEDVPGAADSTPTDIDGEPIGGKPVLSNLHGWYAAEDVVDDVVTYILKEAPAPSQCVQPVADYSKWGDISDKTGLPNNRLPLIITYDATWERSECAVGELLGASVDSDTGELELTINEWFIEPNTERNGVIYCDGVLWTDLVDEVHFGRLNLSRSPEAVLQAAFDEAITAINNAVSISRDAAGRLLLEKEAFSDTDVDDCGNPLQLVNVFKAIDSPLENLALYVKLMKDGHLVTPGDERAPIDRSEKGGIPLWKMLELTDGPSDALRPTIEIVKLEGLGLGSLVDVTAQEYFMYYECYDENGIAIPCLCEGENQDGTPTVVACENVVSRELLAVDNCPPPTDIPGTYPNSDSCVEEPWGIKTDDSVDHGENTTGDDFDFAAAFLAAAADKTGDIGVDMVVYLNSILGINKVIGYSDDGAVNYSEEPVYFDFKDIGETGSYGPYDRGTTFGGRGDLGRVMVLQESATDTWEEQPYEIMDISFADMGIGASGFPDDSTADSDIRGFTQMADDDLSVIKFVHTYQIPGLR